MYLLPLEGVRGEEPSLGEGLGGLLGGPLERHLKLQPYAMLGGCREIEIVEPAHILNAEQLEYIIYSN